MAIKVTSEAFANGQPIPRKYTRDGENVSPALEWSGIPSGTREIALICDDPDAPAPEPWVHWLAYKIPGDAKGLPQNHAKDAKPSGGVARAQGVTSYETVGWDGPAPPPGHGVHRYFFKVYALDAPVEVEPGADKKTLLEAMSDHILEVGELVGTYERKK